MQDREELIRRLLTVKFTADELIKEAFDKYAKNKVAVKIVTRNTDLGDKIASLYPKAKVKVNLKKHANEWEIDFGTS